MIYYVRLHDYAYFSVYYRTDPCTTYRVVGNDAAHVHAPHFDYAIVAPGHCELLIVAQCDARDRCIVAREILEKVTDVEVPQFHYLVFRSCCKRSLNEWS